MTGDKSRDDMETRPGIEASTYYKKVKEKKISEIFKGI